MHAVYVDRSPEMRDVMERHGPPVPASVVIHDGSPSTADLIHYGRHAHILIVERTRVDASVLDASHSLHTLIFMGTGAESYVDLVDAKRRGIRIITTPGYGNRAVAEHALALLLCAARNITRMDRDVRAGHWLPLGGMQLQGRKIAVIGLGGIGSAFAEIATALGMQVAGWNRTPKDLPYFVRDLDTALQGSDAVSLHLALNDETKSLIDDRRLGLPRAGCLLINTARAQLVNEQLLLQALTDGRIGHAALDVFHNEPLSLPNAYSNLPNVTLTSHAAYLTDDACSELWRRALEALASLD
jgi:D-3-phosphoglycerate dehydrogenase / 2-oxoglutarate reductase